MIPQYTITAPPETEPLTLEEASAHLRVDSADDASLITALISVAREQSDALTGHVSAVTSYKLIAPSWAALCGQETNPSYYRARDVGELLNCITLFRSPLASVESIKYIASGDSALTTIDDAEYAVITAARPGIIQILTALPNLADRPDAIQIEFTAGYDGETNIIPPTLKHLVKMLVAHFYETRNPIAFSTPSEIPLTIQHLVNFNRIRGWVA